MTRSCGNLQPSFLGTQRKGCLEMHREFGERQTVDDQRSPVFSTPAGTASVNRDRRLLQTGLNVKGSTGYNKSGVQNKVGGLRQSQTGNSSQPVGSGSRSISWFLSLLCRFLRWLPWPGPSPVLSAIFVTAVDFFQQKRCPPGTQPLGPGSLICPSWNQSLRPQSHTALLS